LSTHPPGPLLFGEEKGELRQVADGAIPPLFRSKRGG